MSLRTQLVLLQSFIMLIIIVGTGVTVAVVQERQIRADYLERMEGVALSVASMPAILDAYDDPDPSLVIQPLANTLQQASDVSYVVLTDEKGIRYSHPDPKRIGEMVSTPPQALDGKVWRGAEQGTMGWSYRFKAPVFGRDGTIIGQVSIGVLESEIRQEYVGRIGVLGVLLGCAAIVGLLLATGAAHIVRRRIFGLEPEEIKAMLDTREATLHGIGDGIIVLDRNDRIQLANDAAKRLLGVDEVQNKAPLSEHLQVDLEALRGSDATKQLALAGERVLLVSADPVVVDGSLEGTVLILLDRTELDAALRELQDTQSMTETLRSHHHEFRNTLHTIGGLLELEEYAAASRLIEHAGGGLNSADATDGIDDIEVAALLLAKRSLARERGVVLSVAPGSTLEAGDESTSSDRITVIGNLIDNAMEAAGEGGTVAITLAETPGSLIITVEDDGPGIALADRDAAFGLGQTSKAGGTSLPRGYGLALVRRVVERVGGSIKIDDSVLGGALIAVELVASPAAREGVNQ